MMRKASLILSCFFLVFVVPRAQAEQKLNYFTTSTFCSRAAGIGWANTALLSSPVDGLYNPATLPASGSRFNIYVNPVGAAMAISSWDRLASNGQESALDEVHRLGLVVKAIAWHTQLFSAAILMSETLPGLPPLSGSHSFLPSDGLLDYIYSRAAVSFHLADPFSIGAAAYLIDRGGAAGDKRSFGGSYGVLIRPDPRFYVGIMYIDVPDRSASAFKALNRTIDEAMNVGISYWPRNNLILSLDVRNVSEEENLTKRELHLGGEWQAEPWLGFRAGYYQRMPERQNVLSSGIGIGTEKSRGERQDSDEKSGLSLDLALHYALQYDPAAAGSAFTHFLTVSVYL